MTNKIVIPGFIYATQVDRYQEIASVINGVCYKFTTYENLPPPYVLVRPHELSFELPKQFNPTSVFVNNLQQEKQALMAQYQNALTDLDRQINELTAITN